ncbi:tRNA(Glu)-specific nuclease WapA precursor [Ruminiclostridium hungatei]|uniref:tRNA(Glu)-specific nuclease WapA n=1 Tax=Ruminiclostridium hungatei TaxID=48256 RepID=A0A1V4SDE7_RUMHU|nr:RHS repeat-associated core domain-containing protein [Ruminiclostridium hungatei]OPX41868.1 tRNA(Glu)-specific nuclease WapA precursor [Ruminiclostridium hungatei]
MYLYKRCIPKWGRLQDGKDGKRKNHQEPVRRGQGNPGNRRKRKKETARNIYGTNLIQRTVTTRENGNTKEETYSYMYNGHGDVTALLGADGTLAASYYYDAFGNALETHYYNASGTETGKAVDNPYRYAGYVYDSTTDLYYLNARMYDAKTARFLQEDTYLGSAGDPLSLNLYTYCHNEPVMYVDPTGHADAKITELAKAAGGEAKWNSQNSSVTVTIGGVSRTFGYNEIKLVNGSAIIENETFDRKFNATNKGVEINTTVNTKTGKIDGTTEYRNTSAVSKSVTNTYKPTNTPASGNNTSGSNTSSANNTSSDKNSGLKETANNVNDFIRGTGAGFLESITYGVSGKLDVYYDRKNNTIYLIGKVTGDSISGILAGIGTFESGVFTVMTAPTIVGAMAGAAATAYCATITVSSAGHAVANIQQIQSQGGSNNAAMFGENGTQVTSKTVWKEKGSQARIDVENPNPGHRPGQIHYQDANGNKYLFDPQKQVFVDKNGNVAPKSVNANLNNPDFVKKLNVGLEQYLGEPGIKLP